MAKQKLVVDISIPHPQAGRPSGNLRELYGTKLVEEVDRQAREGRGKRMNAAPRKKT